LSFIFAFSRTLFPPLTNDGCPMKLVAVDELHAAFLNEGRTRCRFWVPRTGNPGISLVFREMWNSTVSPDNSKSL
jgi:hypothetical protein